jgi:hypothetical protein
MWCATNGCSGACVLNAIFASLKTPRSQISPGCRENVALSTEITLSTAENAEEKKGGEENKEEA